MRALIVALWLLAFFFAALFFLRDAFSLSLFQERDLLRAMELLRGKLEIWGPETNMGGRLPGPFYSLLLAAPIALTGSWESTVPFLALLFALALALAATLVLRLSGFSAALAFTFAIALNPTLMSELWKNWNPSFSLALGLLAGAFALHLQARLARGPAWTGLGMLVACGIQVQGTLYAFVPAVAFALAFDRERARRERAIVLAWFLGGVALPLLPALFSLLTEHQAEQAWSSLPGYFVDFFTRASDDRFALEKVANRLLWDLGPAAALPLMLFGTGSRNRAPEARRAALTGAWLVAFQLPSALVYLWQGYGERYLTTGLSFALLTTAILFRSPAERSLRWLAPAALALCLLRLQWLRSYTPGPFALSPAWTDLLGPLLAGALLLGTVALLRGHPRRHLVAGLVALLAALPHLGPGRGGYFEFTHYGHHHETLLTIGQAKRIERAVAERTGWSYPDFRWRTVMLGVHKHTGLQLTYPAGEASMDSAPGGAAPGGVMLIRLPKPFRGGANIADDYSKSSFADNAKLWYFFLGHQLRTGEEYCEPDGLLCALPFDSMGPVKTTLYHNLGTTYLDEPYPFRHALQWVPESGDFHAELAPGLYLFTWNACRTRQIDCRVGTAVQLRREGSEVKALVTLVGKPISVSARPLAPEWSEERPQPFLEVRCGIATERIELLHSIGHNSKKSDVGVLAPYQAEVTLFCPPASLSEVSVGFAISRTFQATNNLRKNILPATRGSLAVVPPF